MKNKDEESVSYECPYSVENLGVGLVARKFINRNVFKRSFLSFNNANVNLVYSIRPNVNRLRIQAKTFARYVLQHSEVKLRDIFSLTKYEEAENILQDCFFYSYFRCLFYGIYNKMEPDIKFAPPTIHGHSVMYSVIKKGKLRFESNNVVVTYKIDINEKDLEFIMKQFNKLSFHIKGKEVNKFVKTDNLFSWQITKLDRILVLLQKHCSKFIKLSAINSQAAESQLSSRSLPVFNSCYRLPDDEFSDVDVNKWYYCYSETPSLIDHGTCCGKALFLVTKSNADCDLYFDYLDVDDKLNLVRYELSSIAGGEYPMAISDEDIPKTS